MNRNEDRKGGVGVGRGDHSAVCVRFHLLNQLAIVTEFTKLDYTVVLCGFLQLTGLVPLVTGP